MNEDFWAIIDAQIEALEKAKTVDEVLSICPAVPGLSSGHGFFEGSGGDKSVYDALRVAGWQPVAYQARYYWSAREPGGDGIISYVEGDLYRGDRVAVNG